MQVFLIAWCCWKKTRLTFKLLFISLCLQHFNPREEFPSAPYITLYFNLSLEKTEKYKNKYYKNV